MSDQDIKRMILFCLERGDYIDASRLVKILVAAQRAEQLAKLSE